MTSTQNLIPAGIKVTAHEAIIINGDTFETRSPATVLYYDDDTNSYALVAGFRTFKAPAANVVR